MQSLAPLFMTMLSGIHRLEEQEAQDKHKAEAHESVGAAQPDTATETVALGRGQKQDLTPLSTRPQREGGQQRTLHGEHTV